METKWNGQTIETLLVGNYLNTLCISLKEKELLKEMGKWEKAICDRFTFLCLSWIKVLSDFTAMDERNEASVMLAKEIFEQDITFPVLEEKKGKNKHISPVKRSKCTGGSRCFFRISGTRCRKQISGVPFKTSEGTPYFAAEFYQSCNGMASESRKGKSKPFLDQRATVLSAMYIGEKYEL